MIIQNLQNAYGNIIEESSIVWSKKASSDEEQDMRIISLMFKILGVISFTIALPIFLFSVSHITTITGFLGVVTALFFFVLGHDLAVFGRNGYEVHVNKNEALLRSKVSDVARELETVEKESVRKELSEIVVLCQNTLLLGSLWLRIYKKMNGI